MKPQNWDKLTEGQKRFKARQLLQTVRGNYIVGQALSVAINTLSKVEDYPETSNIEDMEMLLEIFGLYALTTKESA